MNPFFFFFGKSHFRILIIFYFIYFVLSFSLCYSNLNERLLTTPTSYQMRYHPLTHSPTWFSSLFVQLFCMRCLALCSLNTWFSLWYIYADCRYVFPSSFLSFCAGFVSFLFLFSLPWLAQYFFFFFVSFEEMDCSHIYLDSLFRKKEKRKRHAKNG